MSLFTRFLSLLGLIVVTATIISCFSCADFMKDEDQYFDFKWNNCKYMTKHKYPYTDKSYEEYEDDYRCYCRYFEFMSPNTLAPIMVTLVLFILWFTCLNFLIQGYKSPVLIRKENGKISKTSITLRKRPLSL